MYQRRLAARKRIDERLGAWTETLDSRAVVERLQAVHVPAGIVAHAPHHIGDPQMAHRGYPKLVDQQGLGTILLEGPAFLGTDLPEVLVSQAPWLGEHTREVASTILGLGDEEIESLIADGTLEDPPGEFGAD